MSANSEPSPEVTGLFRQIVSKLKIRFIDADLRYNADTDAFVLSIYAYHIDGRKYCLTQSIGVETLLLIRDTHIGGDYWIDLQLTSLRNAGFRYATAQDAKDAREAREARAPQGAAAGQHDRSVRYV